MTTNIINENCKFGEVRPRRRKKFTLGLRSKEHPDEPAYRKVDIISTSLQGAVRQFMQSGKSEDFEVGRIYE